MTLTSMKALVFNQGRLLLEPTRSCPHPGQNEAFIRVLLAGVCATDLAIMRGYGEFSGILGHEFIGMVESAPTAPHWIGQRVVGEINLSCASCPSCLRGDLTHCSHRTVMGIRHRDGAFAEYLTLPIANLHPVPEDLEDRIALFTEPLAAALAILQQLHIRPTDRVVVIGDGKLGILVAQVLALNGCDLAVIGHHPHKWGVLTEKKIPVFLESDNPIAGQSDLIVECSGNPTGLALATRLVRPRGRIILKSSFSTPPAMDHTFLTINEITLTGSRCGPFAPALRVLHQGLIAVAPLIDTIYPLSEGIAAITRASEKGALKVLIQP